MKKDKIVINMNELNLNRRKFDSSEIGRGIYVQKPKKGKGSYNRKEKHKNRRNDDSPYFLLKFIY